MIKLIACDLDGTVFDDNKNIDSELKTVVDKLSEKGILFTVISGRNIELMRNVVEHFNLKLPFVCNNGANIYQNNKLVHDNCVIGEYADKAAKLLYDNGIVFRAYTIEDVFCNGISDFFLARMKGFPKPFIDYSRDLDLKQYNTLKITSDFIDHMDKVDEIMEIINNYPDTCMVKAEDHVYCVNNHDATKGNGLRWVCDSLGIDMSEEVMMFGDNENDLSALEAVKVSVAMGNADDYVKSRCDYVCDDNNHNGVSKFLKEYFKDIL